jgi:hypothetical protein
MEPRRLGASAISLALHLTGLAAAVWSTSAPGAPLPPAARPRSIAVFAAPRDDDSGPPGLNAVDPADALALRQLPASTEVALPTFAMNISKIADRASVLFPFVTPGLSLRRFSIASEEDLRETFQDPFAPPPRPRKASRRARPPLALSDAGLQSLIDQSWSRRDRWTPFQHIVTLANAHDPDGGRLPALLHAYHRQNGLQPYVDGSSRDPRLWAELGLAADHVEFIRFISEFASAHPGTKATTELLFLLDQLAQANLDALVTLLDTDPAASLAATRQSSHDAYELIVTLRSHYARQLQRKGLASPETLTSHYEKVRLGILTGILRTTPGGYRASDARFLIGAIHWRDGGFGDALRTWRGMAVDPSDAYATSIGRILDAIAAETGGDRASVDARETTRRLTAQINSILRAEHGRWIMFSMDRLRQFGFHFDTF